MATEQDVAASVARTPIAEVAAYLQELFGRQLTALMVDCRNPKAVGQWARGEREPHARTATSLRNAYHVSRLLRQLEGPETVRSWFLGMNPDLDDAAPALTLAGEPASVLRAARAFIAVG